MACGTPVVVSNRGGLPEVVGDTGELVEPEDPDAIAQAVERAIHSERGRGVERARRFTWERTAREVDRVLRSASGPSL